MKNLTLIFIICLVVTAYPAKAQHVFALDDDFDASDPNAATVTASNLLNMEQFWPYHTALIQDWQANEKASGSLSAGLSGTLIRIKENGTEALVDFGRDGLHAVPVTHLDVVSRAESIRKGIGEKRAENLVLRIGGRLVDGGSDSLRPFIYDHQKDYKAWLVFFADPGSLPFKQMHAFFNVYTAQGDTVFPMLFPLGTKEDAEVLSILQTHAWEIPFLYHFLTPSYLRSIRPDSYDGPAVALYSPEGRLMYAEQWSSKAGYELLQKLEAMRRAL